MTRKALLAPLFCFSLLQAETIEIVKLYLPLSLSDTDSSALTPEGKTASYSTFPCPHALSGARPEELLYSLTTPYKLPSLTPNYHPQDINLFSLNKIEIQIDHIDAGIYKILLTLPTHPHLSLSHKELFTVLSRSITQTLTNYYRTSHTPLSFTISSKPLLLNDTPLEFHHTIKTGSVEHAEKN